MAKEAKTASKETTVKVLGSALERKRQANNEER